MTNRGDATPAARPMTLGGAEAREVSDAIADVLCWFNGFAAARPEATLPPGLPTLRDLNIKLKRTF